jgi:hypothetical protein
MGILDSLFSKKHPITVERDVNGVFSYWFNNGLSTGINENNYLEYALNHPILNTILMLRAKMVSQARIYLVDDNGKELENDEALKLIKNPNYFQSQQDFIYQAVYFMGATGNNYTYTPRASKNILPTNIYNLLSANIDFKNVLDINYLFKNEKQKTAFDSQLVKYTLNNEVINIQIGDLIPMYDIVNGLREKNIFKSPSRIEGLEDPLQNILELFKSKNINAKMSQKYLAVNRDSVKARILDDDREAIKKTILSNSLQVTNGNVEITHLVSDLKKLALDPQIGFDAQAVLLGYGLNNDVLNYLAGGSSTFENQEKGEIRAYQNEIQGIADNLCNSLTSGLNLQNKRFKASYDHLPIMQAVFNDKVDSFKKYQETLKIAIDAGTLTVEEAKQMTKDYINKIGL